MNQANSTPLFFLNILLFIDLYLTKHSVTFNFRAVYLGIVTSNFEAQCLPKVGIFMKKIWNKEVCKNMSWNVVHGSVDTNARTQQGIS